MVSKRTTPSKGFAASNVSWPFDRRDSDKPEKINISLLSILGNPGATSRDDAIFLGESLL